MPEIRFLCGDCIEVMRTLGSGSIHTCVTSPPYFGLRDYGVDGQIGLEPTIDDYVAKMVEVFREVWRVLRDDGTLWLNLGDSYASGEVGRHDGCEGRLYSSIGESQGNKRQRKSPLTGMKPKNLIGMPWRVAFALQADGWYLRSDIIWHKPNPMPESVTDRPTKSHEYIFLMSKDEQYYYDCDAIKEKSESLDPRVLRPSENFKMMRSNDLEQYGLTRGSVNQICTHSSGKNRRSVWKVATQPFNGAHFATFPPKLIEPCILAGTSEDGCCPDCLAPRIRVIDKERVATRPGRMSKVFADPSNRPDEVLAGTIVGRRNIYRHCTSSLTVGWEAGCGCGAGPAIPCTVLDPFSGAGTTGLVCLDKGCNHVGIELNPAYLALAERRIADHRAKTPLLDLID